MKIAKQEKKLLNPKNNHEKIKETISETQVLKSELENNVEKVQQVYKKARDDIILSIVKANEDIEVLGEPVKKKRGKKIPDAIVN